MAQINSTVGDLERNAARIISAIAEAIRLTSISAPPLPLLLDRMTHLHKAKSSDPLFFLNIFFGASLFFFVISAFWMFMPGTPIFKKGMYFAAGGIILVLLLLLI